MNSSKLIKSSIMKKGKNMSRIREDFIKARHILATHSGRIKERLIAAGRTGITSYDVKELPSHLQEDYEDLDKILTKPNENVIGDGATEQTVNGISEDEAVDIANQLMEFSTRLLETDRKEFR